MENINIESEIKTRIDNLTDLDDMLQIQKTLYEFYNKVGPEFGAEAKKHLDFIEAGIILAEYEERQARLKEKRYDAVVISKTAEYVKKYNQLKYVKLKYEKKYNELIECPDCHKIIKKYSQNKHVNSKIHIKSLEK